VNVLSKEIPPGNMYCFPPPNMVSAVVKHVMSFPGIKLTVVAPSQAAAWMGVMSGHVKSHRQLERGAIVDHAGNMVDTKFGCWILSS
jgi:hypothetical protein